MTAYQLSIFPNEQPVPIDLLNKKTHPKKLQIQLIVIEQNCSTDRAAELLDVSTSTLYRARKAGKPYQKGAWTVKAIGANAWTVLYNPNQSH